MAWEARLGFLQHLVVGPIELALRLNGLGSPSGIPTRSHTGKMVRDDKSAKWPGKPVWDSYSSMSAKARAIESTAKWPGKPVWDSYRPTGRERVSLPATA